MCCIGSCRLFPYLQEVPEPSHWPLVADQSAWEPAYGSKGKWHWERCGLLSPQELQRRGLWRAVQEYHQVSWLLHGVSVLAAA